VDEGFSWGDFPGVKFSRGFRVGNRFGFMAKKESLILACALSVHLKKENEKSPDVPFGGSSGLFRAVPPARLFSTASGLRLWSVTHGFLSHTGSNSSEFLNRVSRRAV
jgi:hypothetical protein